MPGESPEITGAALAPAIDLSQRQYIWVEGLYVHDVRRWLYALDAHHNWIRENTFRVAVHTLWTIKCGNRIAHNVFWGTDFAGVEISAGSEFDDNLFVNNVLAGSVFVANDSRWSWYTDVLAGQPVPGRLRSSMREKRSRG